MPDAPRSAPGARRVGALSNAPGSGATKPKGSQFVLHAKPLDGNFFEGHTLPNWTVN